MLPVFFGHGLIGNALTPLLAGGRVHFWPTPSLAELGGFGPYLDANRISFMSSVPSFWKLATRVSPPPTLPLRRVQVGSAPLSLGQWRDIARFTGTDNVHNLFGMTETANWIAGGALAEAGARDGYVGRAWGGELAILDASGAIAPSGRGEVLVKSPSLMLGYWERPDLDQEAFVEGWFRTGDIGELAADGSLVLVGRIKTEINRGGIKIQAEEVDMLLERHPDIVEACAFGVPDAVAGEAVAAAIVLRPGASFDPEAIKAFCRKRRAPTRCPPGCMPSRPSRATTAARSSAPKSVASSRPIHETDAATPQPAPRPDARNRAFPAQTDGFFRNPALTASWRKDPEILTGLYHSPRPRSLFKWIEQGPMPNNVDRFTFAIIDKATGAPIGCNGVRFCDYRSANFTVALRDRAWWGRGVVAEVRVALINHFFRHAPVDRFVGIAQRAQRRLAVQLSPARFRPCRHLASPRAKSRHRRSPRPDDVRALARKMARLAASPPPISPPPRPRRPPHDRRRTAPAPSPPGPSRSRASSIPGRASQRFPPGTASAIQGWCSSSRRRSAARCPRRKSSRSIPSARWRKSSKARPEAKRAATPGRDPKCRAIADAYSTKRLRSVSAAILPTFSAT